MDVIYNELSIKKNITGVKQIQLSCIIDKCLKYPVCKYKEVLYCSMLNNYLYKEMNTVNSSSSVQYQYDWWNVYVRPSFPHLSSVGQDNK